jgi:hypothetical protein
LAAEVAARNAEEYRAAAEVRHLRAHTHTRTHTHTHT